jgi:hypothetical protein
MLRPGACFVHVIIHIINKNNIVACRPTTKKEYGGLSSTRLGKGGAERLGKRAKLKSLNPRE